MALFEVQMYNELVKRAIEAGEPSSYSDDWADLRYVEVSARDETDARRKIFSKYPKERGFMIKAVEPA